MTNTTPMAFFGTLGHFKLIQGRKVAQFIVEVPTEMAMDALKTIGGMPRPDAPFAVAVARITNDITPREDSEVLQSTVAAGDEAAGREAASVSQWGMQ